MNAGERYRATYEFRSVDHLVRKEFGFFEETVERWKEEGIPADYEEKSFFNYDPPGIINVGLNMGWEEPPFIPTYEEKVLKNEGATEIIQDKVGRSVRVFKEHGNAFMPTYLKHPVTSMKDWKEQVAPRLDPENPTRYENIDELCNNAKRARECNSLIVRQGLIGGYMFLRALMGPEDVLYAFINQPQLIHAMMQRWTELMDKGCEEIQTRLSLDELAIGEDICYNHGLLISPDMVKEFLIPYYQQVVGNAYRHQSQRLYFNVDTDGWVVPAIPLYREAGMNIMGPFEVASGCDVVKIGQEWPDLIMSGGIDKRVLAQGKDAINKHLEHIIPNMLKRGGYIPTCDHNVPSDVSLDNYIYYRRRICELDH